MAHTLPEMPGGWNDLRALSKFMDDHEGRKAWFKKVEKLLAEIDQKLEGAGKLDAIDTSLLRAQADQKMAAEHLAQAREKAAAVAKDAEVAAKALRAKAEAMLADARATINAQKADLATREATVASRIRTLEKQEADLAQREQKATSLLSAAQERNLEADGKIERINRAIG